MEDGPAEDATVKDDAPGGDAAVKEDGQETGKGVRVVR
jgi:phosphoribosylamine-glycine ligase